MQVKSRKMESKKPTYGWTVLNGEIQLQLTSNWVIFGSSATSPNGQQWVNVYAVIPKEFSDLGQIGVCGFTQIIVAKKDLYRAGSSYPIQNLHYNLPALDVSFPYPYNLPWPANLPYYGFDSPAQLLSFGLLTDLTAITINDTFQTWLMYKPPTAGLETSWVPLASYSWAWSAEVSRVTGEWVLGTRTGGLVSGPTMTSSHPTWQRVLPMPIPF